MAVLSLKLVYCTHCTAAMGAVLPEYETADIPPFYCSLCVSEAMHYAEQMHVKCEPSHEDWMQQRNAAMGERRFYSLSAFYNQRIIDVIRHWQKEKKS